MGFALGSSDAFGWGNLTRMALHTAVGFWVLGLRHGGAGLARRDGPGRHPALVADQRGDGSRHGAVGLWQALIAGGQAPFALIPAVALGGGCLMATIFGLTVYLAQRAHTQAVQLQRTNRMLEGHIAQRADAERRTSLALDAGQMGTWELDLATDDVGSVAQA